MPDAVAPAARQKSLEDMMEERSKACKKVTESLMKAAVLVMMKYDTLPDLSSTTHQTNPFLKRVFMCIATASKIPAPRLEAWLNECNTKTVYVGGCVRNPHKTWVEIILKRAKRVRGDVLRLIEKAEVDRLMAKYEIESEMMTIEHFETSLKESRVEEDEQLPPMRKFIVEVSGLVYAKTTEEVRNAIAKALRQTETVSHKGNAHLKVGASCEGKAGHVQGRACGMRCG
jgi:hypothetical protein